jgi:hypothetical protein
MLTILSLVCLFHGANQSSSGDQESADAWSPACRVPLLTNRETVRPGSPGRVGIGVAMSSKLALFRVGGEWTQKKPFYVIIPLGYHVYVWVTVALADERIPRKRRVITTPKRKSITAGDRNTIRNPRLTLDWPPVTPR